MNAAADKVAVVDVATDSTMAQLTVPRGSRRVGFDFNHSPPRIYITNEVVNALSSSRRRRPTLSAAREHRAAGRRSDGAARAVRTAASSSAIARRTTSSSSIPLPPPGSTTLARTPIQGLPFDIELAAGKIFVPTFVPSTGGVEGFNRVLTVSPSTFQVTGNLLQDVGTDYVDIAATDSLIAIAAASTGTVIFADPVTGAMLDNVELAPGHPTRDAAAAGVRQQRRLADQAVCRGLFPRDAAADPVAGGPPFTSHPRLRSPGRVRRACRFRAT